MDKVKKNRSVCGVGVNDADYVVQVKETVRYVDGKQKQSVIWICPFYSRWQSMLARCYSKKFLLKRPTYTGCYVSEEWLLFSNFKSWMETQDWGGNQLDKDILFEGNKEYISDTCVFVSGVANSFMTDSGKARGEWPIGVSFHKSSGKFQAQCRNPTTGKQENLGLFSTAESAHAAWIAKKLEHAYSLAALQTDPRVAAALIERYENYQS